MRLRGVLLFDMLLAPANGAASMRAPARNGHLRWRSEIPCERNASRSGSDDDSPKLSQSSPRRLTDGPTARECDKLRRAYPPKEDLHEPEQT